MAKILLVEDDSSLREIYSIRLTAEGYEVVSAGDGEAALAAAVREKPDLVLSDVMMPKISGFDMLDILRQTPETKDIKVIMMTALSSEDQRERGNALGADRYLVKSQVGIEDVVNAVHEVMGDNGAAPIEAAPAAETGDEATAEPAAVAPVEPAAAPAVEPIAPVAEPVAEPVAAPVVEQPVATPVEPVTEPVAAPVAEPAAPAAEVVAEPAAAPVETVATSVEAVPTMTALEQPIQEPVVPTDGVQA